MPRSPAAMALLALLTACGGGSREDRPPAVTELCVADTCGRLIDIATIPDAENTLITPDGRVFVSGGTGVFEITRAGSGYQALAIHETACNFTGMALRGDVLYANCFDGRLYAAALTASPRLRAIHELGLAAPNGLVTGPDDALYLVNGPVATTALPDPKIVRLRFHPTDPFVVTEQTDWLASGLTAPNGLAIRGRDLLVSDSSLLPPVLGRIERIHIDDDGQPGARESVGSFLSLLDDFSVIGDRLLVTLYTQGSVALIGADGAVLQQTGPLGLAFPSSVRLADSPLFEPGDLLITQKGIIGDTLTPYGNRLSLLRPNKE